MPLFGLLCIELTLFILINHSNQVVKPSRYFLIHEASLRQKEVPA